MLTQIELGRLADFMLEVVECDEAFEDDEFGIEFEGHRFYVERYLDNYRIELGHQDDVVFIPRH